MITSMERKALDNRREDSETIDMLKRSYDVKKKKLKLVYPDGREKIIDGTNIDIQKLMKHCDSAGVIVTEVKEGS